MVRLRAHISRFALAVVLFSLAAFAVAVPPAAATQNVPGGPLVRSDTTPFAPSQQILDARWTTGRFDPPANQAGDILPTVWTEDGSSYVLMDDGGVDAPAASAFWRQSFARITGTPPNLSFQHVGNPTSPPARTWSQIGGDIDKDDGPLGPYYSTGFVEAGGVFYATQQRNWDWDDNGLFTGLAGVAYSRDGGKTWHSGGKGFPAPLGNLTFVDHGGRGGVFPDGYLYAIGTEREFNASKLLLGRVRPGVANVTDPARWQWLAGYRTGADGKRTPIWSSSLASATGVMSWNSHITYPQMTYDAPLHRYLLTFSYSYSSDPPAVWSGGAELVILDAPTPWGPFSFVARSRDFGPSNGYGAGFPSQWISSDGRTLWLKWAANFVGCQKGLDCSGKYGFNLAHVQLTVAPKRKPTAIARLRAPVLYALSASFPLLLALMLGRSRARSIRAALRRPDQR